MQEALCFYADSAVCELIKIIASQFQEIVKELGFESWRPTMNISYQVANHLQIL